MANKNIQDMSKEELDDYFKQGTYGVTKLYHDTGMPDKANEYEGIQKEIQDKVYGGNFQLMDIQDRDQLKSAAQKTRAVQQAYNGLPKDATDDDVKALAFDVAHAGGPDLRRFSPDMQRQGIGLWSKTFDDVMSSIAQSPRGRELYGDVLESAYDDNKNQFLFDLKGKQVANSPAGQDATKLQQYVEGHWSKPRISNQPERDGVDLGVSDILQPNNAQPVAEGTENSALSQMFGVREQQTSPQEEQAPINKLDRAIVVSKGNQALKADDIDGMVEFSKVFNGLNPQNPIDTSSPWALKSSMSRVLTAHQIMENNSMAGGGEFDKKNTAIENEKLKLEDGKIQAQSLIDQGHDEQNPDLIKQGQLLLVQNKQQKSQFMRSNMSEADRKNYEVTMKQPKENYARLDAQSDPLLALLAEKLRGYNSATGFDKRTIEGSQQKIYDAVADFAGSLNPDSKQKIQAAMQSIADPSQGYSFENMHKAASDYVMLATGDSMARGAAVKENVDALMQADPQAVVNMLREHYKALNETANQINTIDDNVDETGQVGRAATKGRSFDEIQQAITSAVPKVKKIVTKDGDTLADVQQKNTAALGPKSENPYAQRTQNPAPRQLSPEESAELASLLKQAGME